MTGLPEMFAGVLAWAGIAATDVPACQAHAQVGPRVLTVLSAVLAMSRCPGIRLGGINRGFEVFACFGGLRIGGLRMGGLGDFRLTLA